MQLIHFQINNIYVSYKALLKKKKKLLKLKKKNLVISFQMLQQVVFK